jgi:hypothetical protein
MAAPAAKTLRRSIQSIADFEAAYVPKEVRLQKDVSSPHERPMPDLVSDALRSLRQTLR